MNMKLSDDFAVKLAMWIAVVAMIGALAFMLVIPKPSTKGFEAKRLRSEKQILVDISSARANLTTSTAKVVSRTWTGGLQEVGPGALQSMNALATKHKVKLSGFRPERTSQSAGVDLVPFSVTAEGSFLDVVAFVKAIEDPANKLAVDTVQVASSEANSDQATATVGITAYHVAEVAKHA
jgi:hypothetical protein